MTKGASSSLSRRRFSRSKPDRGMKTSPLTSTSETPRLPGSLLGMEGIVLMLAVTSSPRVPSPRVAATSSRPSTYLSDMLMPSSLGSTTYSTGSSGSLFLTLASNARSSSGE